MRQWMKECSSSIVCANGNITETHTQVLLQQEPPALHSFLGWKPSPWKTGTYYMISEFSDNSAVGEYEGLAKLFKLYPVIW
jgi:hypothetical protein